MTLTRKDAVATSLTGLAVLAFLATHEAWNVPLIGDSHRWAAAVIMVLGVGACAAGARRVTSTLYSCSVAQRSCSVCWHSSPAR